MSKFKFSTCFQTLSNNSSTTQLGGSKKLKYNNNASYCSPFKVKVEDTSGAGDAFMAGLIFATLNEYSLNYSMIFSSACAANNIQHVGASGNVPYFNKVEKFINENLNSVTKVNNFIRSIN